MSQLNDWGVPFSVIRSFSDFVSGNRNVLSISRTRDILFEITRKDDSRLCVVLVNEYILGKAAVLLLAKEFPEAEYIVTGTSWNRYTQEAKEEGRLANIGIFNSAEFFRALWSKDPKAYVRKDASGKPDEALTPGD
jgi:hypothetical protein